MSDVSGADSGSRASIKPASGLDPSGFDPGEDWIRPIVRSALSVATYGTIADVQAQIAHNAAKAALASIKGELIRQSSNLRRYPYESATMNEAAGMAANALQRTANQLEAAIAMEAATAGETRSRLDAKRDSAGRQASPKTGLTIQSEPTEAMRLAGLMDALAGDCANTDGWHGAEADCRLAATLLRRFATRTDTQDRAALRAKINDRFSKSLEYLSDSTDAVEASIAKAFLAKHTSSAASDGYITGCRSPTIEEWRAFAAALTPSQSDNGDA